ncbi:MAG: hypothetical protein FJ291_05235 [Planctomycetes bacterium]|nr:hypothetical protein [Planctomycetota bacterium]
MWKLACLLASVPVLATWAAQTEKQAAATFREAVEADWLTQDRVRGAAFKAGPAVTTREDAAGAVDGKKDGKWAFHTGEDNPPWWHVDLGQSMALDRVVVFNRCDAGCPERNRNTDLLLSQDGKAWETVYRHAGKPAFGGIGFGEPLSVKLEGKGARFVRLQLAHKGYFHLDEVEVYGTADPKKNIALGCPADQSSVSQWSVTHDVPRPGERPSYPFALALERGRKLAADLLGMVDGGTGFQPVGHRQDACATRIRELEAVAKKVEALPKDASPEAVKAAYLELRWAVRRLAFANPLLDFNGLVFTKKKPCSFSHMSDQHYGWWSVPGGGVFVLTGMKGEEPQARCLTPDMPVGSFMQPDLSYDGKRILFAYCHWYAKTAGNPNKVDKKSIPEDAFYHVYEIGVDGTGLRQLTRGCYDDFDPRYLPDGRIAFLSTRRGQAFQCGKGSAQATLENPYLPDSYVRCGGDNARPVAVYTLHRMDPDGTDLVAISPFESFEWTPSVAHDGRILYARWDYVDRHNMPFMKLWSVHPDGGLPNLVYGGFTRNPHCVFEARAIPGSHKLIFTASAHHAITAGSLCLLDPSRGTEETPPITRLTPDVCFPESEGWPSNYFANPYPLSERYHLVAWCPKPIQPHQPNGTGLYLFDAFGNLELIYRDPEIACTCPLPLRPRPKPHELALAVGDDRANPEGRFLVLDVYRGLTGIAPGSVKRLRLVGVPAKTQPHMNTPNLGATADDPGKCVLGTVPVEADGSAHFKVPAGVNLFLQALDADGLAIQTMRTITSVQPGHTVSCIGCHEQRQEAAPNVLASAAARPPAPITPGPEGSWPLRYDKLVQPVLDKHCVRCHAPGGDPKAVAKLDLTPAKSYGLLVNYGGPSLYAHVRGYYGKSQSDPGKGAALTSPILAHLRKGHKDAKLDPDAWERLITWMDTYAQRQGHFSPEQEAALAAFRQRLAPLLAERR